MASTLCRTKSYHDKNDFHNFLKVSNHYFLCICALACGAEDEYIDKPVLSVCFSVRLHGNPLIGNLVESMDAVHALLASTFQKQSLKFICTLAESMKFV